MEKNTARIVDTILSVPGMNDTVKLSLQVSRKNIFFLSKLIDDAIPGGTPHEFSLEIPKESLEEIRRVLVEILSKSGLEELYDKLKKI